MLIPYSKVEHPASDGCTGIYACGPLLRPRYINPKLERELVEFKAEVEEKFQKSPIRTFVYPRISSTSNFDTD